MHGGTIRCRVSAYEASRALGDAPSHERDRRARERVPNRRRARRMHLRIRRARLAKLFAAREAGPVALRQGGGCVGRSARGDVGFRCGDKVDWWVGV